MSRPLYLSRKCTLAILALAAEFPEVPAHSVRFLLSVQRGDGSWPAFRGDDDGSWTTALAALTLSRVSVDSRVRGTAPHFRRLHHLNSGRLPAWTVDFRLGIVSYKDKTEKLRVGAVRDGN
jgi:hypothetical protein